MSNQHTIPNQSKIEAIVDKSNIRRKNTRTIVTDGDQVREVVVVVG